MGTNGKGKFQDGHGREPEELAINPAEARQELVATLESTKAEIERLFNEFKTANQDQLDLIREAEAALAKAMKKIGQLKSIEAVVARKETLVASLENLKSKGQGTTEQLSVLEQRLKNAETDFASRSGEIFRKVINLETKVELVGFKTITEENVAEFGDEELVDVDVPFVKGLPGQVTFLLEKGFTAKVVDWMIMGDGEVEFMPEEHLDGIVEAVNELMGNELTELSARVGISLRNEVRPAYLETPDNIKKYYLGCHAAKFEVKIDIGTREHPKEGSFVMWKLIAPETGQRLSEWLGDRPVEKPDEEPEDANLEQVREAEAPGVAPVGPEAPAVASESPAPERRIISIEKCLSHIHGRVGVDESIIQRYEAEIDTLKTKLEGESFGLPISEDDLSAGLQEIMSRFDAEVGTNFAVTETGSAEPEVAPVVPVAATEALDVARILLPNDFKSNIAQTQSLDDLKEYLRGLAQLEMVVAYGEKRYFFKDLFAALEAWQARGPEPDMPAVLKAKLTEFGSFNDILLATDFEATISGIDSLEALKAYLQSLANERRVLDFGEEKYEADVLFRRLNGFSRSGNQEPAMPAVLRVKLEELGFFGDVPVEPEIPPVEQAPEPGAPAEPSHEPETPAEEADQTQKWFEGRDKLKMVDISPEKIKEILGSVDIIAHLKTYLLDASVDDGRGKNVLQEGIVSVLQDYFATQNLNLSETDNQALQEMISALAGKTSEQIVESFTNSLDYQAQADLGFFDKMKAKLSALTGAQLASTLAVGIGVAALTPILAPLVGVAAVGWGATGIAGGLAVFGRYGVGKIFNNWRSSEKHVAKMSAKEQAQVDKIKSELINYEPGVEVDGTAVGREFINLDSLASVISSTLRTNTSEDFRQGKIFDDEGNLCRETVDILKANIQDLLDNDPRYADLNPEEKDIKAKQLFTTFSMELIQKSRNVLDLGKNVEDPGMIKVMQRLQDLLAGKVSGLDKINTDNAAIQLGAAALVGAGLRMAYTHSKVAAATTSALSGALMGWSIGSSFVNKELVGQYYREIDNQLENGEKMLQSIVVNEDVENDGGQWSESKFNALENHVLTIRSLLSLKTDNGDDFIADPIIRARAENFIHQFETHKNAQINYDSVYAYTLNQVDLLRKLQENVDLRNDQIVERLAKNLKDGSKKDAIFKYLLLAGGATAGVLAGLAFGGRAEAHIKDGVDVNTSTTESIPDTSNVAGQDSLVSPVDSLAQQAASQNETLDGIDATHAASINPAEAAVTGGGAGAAAQATAEHAGAAGVTAGVGAQHFEDVIHTEDGGSADSIWRSTRDIVKAHPSDFGYHGTDDAGEIARFAETQTANLVHQLDQAQGGHLADLVHEGDKVSIDFVDSKPVLHFEDSSGLEAGHLSDIHHAAPSAVEHTPAPEVAPVVPVTPTLENISSDAFVNKVFESSQDVQEKFLHDIDPNHFTGANNKAEIFLKTITESQKIKLEDINSLEELQKHLAAFDRLVDNKSLPGNTWTPRLFSDGQGHEIYALVKAKGGLFSFLGEKQYLVDTTGGKPFSISETGLRNMLENHNVNIDASQNVLTENLPVEPKAEVIEPSAETQIVHEGGIDFAGTYSATERANILEHLRGKNIEFENLKTQFAQLARNPEYNKNPNWPKFVDMFKQSLQGHIKGYNDIVADLDNPSKHLNAQIFGNMPKLEAAQMQVDAEISQLAVKSGLRNVTELAQDKLDATWKPTVESVVPELATSVDTTFEQLSGLKEGAEFHHDDLVIFKQDGKLFTWDLSEKNLLEVRNQADLDRFAGK